MIDRFGEVLLVRPIRDILFQVVVWGDHNHTHIFCSALPPEITPHERFGRFCDALARAANLDGWEI